jgi:hypothetical protein
VKKPAICLILILGTFSFLSAQERMKFSELTANIGKGAFTSGFDITLKFEAEKRLLEITGNHERGYMVHLWKLPMSVKAGVSGGIFNNMPWAGPYVLATPTEFLSLLYWRGWGAGEPDNPGTEINGFFESMGIFLKWKGIKLSYVHATFMGEKNHLPGISFTVPINEKFSCFAGIDYKSSEDTPLFRIGVSHFPEK